MKENKEDILTLEYMRKIDTISNLIKDLSNLKFHEDLVKDMKIELVDNVEFLARTGFNEKGKAIAMEINRKITKVNLKKVFIKVLLHEIAHIVAESKYVYSGHGEKYKHTCMLLGIPYYEKIKLTKEEMEEFKND